MTTSPFSLQNFGPLLLAALTACPLAAHAEDDDALSLQSDAPAAAPASNRPWRLYAEGTVGSQHDRYTGQNRSSRRLSIDFNINQRLGEGWRAALSDRLDAVHPTEAGADSAVNSLREAYVGWQDGDKTTAIDFGRINLRNGPAYGYNPTDFFRAGALRAVTTADPLALRENRLGTVMLRGQRLWQGGALTVALAPKLANAPSREGFSADWGATNAQHRALVTASQQLSERISGQALWYAEKGQRPQWGLNATALLTDALVAQAEWTHGHHDSLFGQYTGQDAGRVGRNKAAAGLTYTLPTKLSVTLEFQYNAAAPSRAAWDAASAGPPETLVGYLIDASARQDSASRNAWLLYAMQKNLFVKNLDMAGLWRKNTVDGSSFTWAELRYHWPQFDAAVQWQLAHGRRTSEYGILPTRQWLQLLGAWYF